MKFAAVGDALILRRIPQTYPGFEAVRDWISEADAKYFNLETTLHREGDASLFPPMAALTCVLSRRCWRIASGTASI